MLIASSFSSWLNKTDRPLLLLDCLVCMFMEDTKIAVRRFNAESQAQSKPHCTSHENLVVSGVQFQLPHSICGTSNTPYSNGSVSGEGWGKAPTATLALPQAKHPAAFNGLDDLPP